MCINIRNDLSLHPKKTTTLISYLLLYSGLLNFNGPGRDRPLLANGAENVDFDEDDDNKNDEEEENLRVEEEALMVQSCATIEEHIIEHLPPNLNKGNITEGLMHH